MYLDWLTPAMPQNNLSPLVTTSKFQMASLPHSVAPPIRRSRENVF